MRFPSGNSERGQTLVEVALILPIFILSLVAVVEFGWYAGVTSAATTASREAARYGSTVGTNGSGDPHYIDCAGIRAAAREITTPLITLTDAQIEITYDDGTGTSVATPCVSTASRPAVSDLDRFDRVIVEVTVVYQPITPLLSSIIGTPTLVSRDSRSIAKPS
jgi:Flp pilus assembly protein TadG